MRYQRRYLVPGSHRPEASVSVDELFSRIDESGEKHDNNSSTKQIFRWTTPPVWLALTFKLNMKLSRPAATLEVDDVAWYGEIPTFARSTTVAYSAAKIPT